MSRSGGCLGLLLLAGAVSGPACHRGDEPGPPDARIAELKAAHDRLRAQLDRLVAADPLLAAAPGEGTVTVGLRATLVRDLFGEVARRYLEAVAFDIRKPIRVHEAGELKTRTFLGDLKAGDWTLDLTVRRVSGLVRARAPRVDFTGGDRVRVSLGVQLERAEGQASVRFSWRSSRVASVVCRDFDVDVRDLTGTALPAEYPVAGSFVLSAGRAGVRARPAFPEPSFRLRVDLSPASWARVRRALEAQDTLLRCGLALDPDALLAKLRQLGRAGFDVRLPRSLFRAVELPATLQESVRVEDRRVELSVRPETLRATPDTLWYGATVRARVTGSP